MSMTRSSSHSVAWCDICEARERIHVDGVCIVCQGGRRFEVVLERTDSGWTSLTLDAWEGVRNVARVVVRMSGPTDDSSEHEHLAETARLMAATLRCPLVETA